MSKWPVKSLKSCINVKHGYPFKSEFFSDTGNYIVLTPGNFYEEGGFKSQAGKEKFYTGEVPEDYLHEKGDLIVAMTEQAAGLLGSCAIVPESNLYLHNQRLGLITTNEDKVLKDYIYHLFKTSIVREQIRLTSSGSKVKHTSPERIYSVKAPLPPVEEQRKIVGVFNALDKKIELNNRINAGLESMAKTLYDYWFVQFDFPFDFAQGKPDANGKPYKTSGGKMVYNPTLKREIPEGWEVWNLEDLVDVVKGNISPSGIDPNTPYVGLEHIGRKTIVLSDWSTSNSANSDKTLFSKHDILFGKIRPYFHKVAVALFDGITSTDTILLRPKKNYYFGFSLETIFTEKFIEAATQSSTGSKMPRADWSVLRYYQVPVPNVELLKSYQQLFESILRKIEIAVHENKSLGDFRDWLLPMLMNGQVTVK